MEDRSSEASSETLECLEPPAAEPVTAAIGETKMDPSMALNATNRQLETVNAALTELQAASERGEMTVRMLERINADWDELDARLEILASVAVDHDRWTRESVDNAHERLHKLLERGVLCEAQAAQTSSGLLLKQLRRLARRLLINRDLNHKRQDARTHPDDLIGRNMGGFILRGRIAEGGFGTVYRCEQPLLGREAVVKVLRRELRRSKVVARRFLREARLASRLDHPYAAHVYAFGIDEQDWVLWIAMERVHGVTFAEWLKLHGPMPLGQFVPFFERIAAVVQTAHEHGIVHRDLKPSNVMVIERAGEILPKLLDFGVAKLLDSADPPGEIDIHHPLPLAMEDSASGLGSIAGYNRRPFGPVMDNISVFFARQLARVSRHPNTARGNALAMTQNQPSGDGDVEVVARVAPAFDRSLGATCILMQSQVLMERPSVAQVWRPVSLRAHGQLTVAPGVHVFAAGQFQATNATTTPPPPSVPNVLSKPCDRSSRSSRSSRAALRVRRSRPSRGSSPCKRIVTPSMLAMVGPRR